MGRFVGATIVIVGAAPSASMQNLVGAGSSWIRLRRSTNSLFQMRSLILGDTKESTGFANTEVSCLPGSEGKTTSAVSGRATGTSSCDPGGSLAPSTPDASLPVAVEALPSEPRSA